ncbi:MAG: AI-2E family transporter [Methylocystis sp.]|uniref:AI-2E family transporter n=1 Tax=Methylocystis sp. TaxID=1911079 RepID=UPI003DA69372
MILKRGDESAPPTQASIPEAAAVAVLLALLVIVPEVRWALLPFVLAVLLAYLCTPLVDKIAAHFRLSRLIAVISVYASLLAMLAVVALFGVPPLVHELKRLISDMQSVLRTLAQGLVDDHAVTILGKSMDPQQMADAATSGIRDWLGATGRITEFAAMSFATLFGGILVLVLLFYMLAQGPEIVRGVLWLIPRDKRAAIERVWILLDPLLWRYVIGVLIVVAYATVAAYVGLGFVLGLKHAFFLALLTGLLEMIPVIGPGSSALIGGLVAIHNAAGILPVISYAAYVIVLRLSIDQILGPLVLGKAAALSPVTIIFCFLLGGALFGIAGVILAVPVAIAIKTSIGVLRDETPVG